MEKMHTSRSEQLIRCERNTKTEGTRSSVILGLRPDKGQNVNRTKGQGELEIRAE